MSDSSKDNRPPSLTGTTLRVYRYLYRNGEPAGIREIQRDLGLSSASVAEYHIRKLVAMGLVKATEESRYTVDKVIFESMIRIRKSFIPIQIGYLAFFLTSFVVLLLILRPSRLTNDYIFALIVVSVACVLFGYQSIRSLRSIAI